MGAAFDSDKMASRPLRVRFGKVFLELHSPLSECFDIGASESLRPLLIISTMVASSGMVRKVRKECECLDEGAYVKRRGEVW